MSVRLHNVKGVRAALQFYVVVGTVRREFGFYGPFSILYLHLLHKMETRDQQCRARRRRKQAEDAS